MTESKVVTASSHDRIMAAAKHLFATRGYENTSTIMIARSAGTSESQLVKHFGSKDGLLEAIFNAGWQNMADLFTVVDEAASPTEKLRLILQQTLAGLERDPELKELMLLEARRIRRQDYMVLMTRGFMEFTHRVDMVLTAMAERGELHPGLRPQAVRSALIGMAEGMLRDELLARRMSFDVPFNSDDMWRVLNVMLPALLAEDALQAAAR
jgi:AcrR family transcriptional regulator